MIPVPTFQITRITKAAMFGEGQWLDEPDRLEWRTVDLPCLAVRNPLMGQWCGYVGVPPDHPLHGRDKNNTDDLSVHGGITYAAACEGPICHVPQPGEPEHVWWFGFDCGHVYDLVPGIHGRQASRAYQPLFYRSLSYVRLECCQLALQLRAWPLVAEALAEPPP